MLLSTCEERERIFCIWYGLFFQTSPSPRLSAPVSQRGIIVAAGKVSLVSKVRS